MILFSFPLYEYLAKTLLRDSKLKRGKFESKRFANGEMQIVLKDKVKGEKCVILGTTAPSDTNILSLLLLAHTLKKEGASSVTALIPYLGYSRHDKNEAGKSLGSAWLGKVMKVSGIDKIVTIDTHSELDKKLLVLPLISLSFANLFATNLKKIQAKEINLVAPDSGAIDNCLAIKKILNNKLPLILFKKIRTAQGVTVSTPSCPTPKKVLIVDDILDTGETLVKVANKLHRAGTKEIYIVVTHGLFTGLKWQKLWQLGVKKIFCTNTNPNILRKKDKRIIIVSCLESIQGYFK